MSNSYSIEFFPAALKDLEDIYAYYYEQSKELEIANNATNTIKDSLFMLIIMFESCPKILEKRLANKDFRKLVFGEYFIPFLIDEKRKTVSIVRVFHGKSDYLKFL